LSDVEHKRTSGISIFDFHGTTIAIDVSCDEGFNPNAPAGLPDIVVGKYLDKRIL
jgi:hypothetical protein